MVKGVVGVYFIDSVNHQAGDNTFLVFALSLPHHDFNQECQILGFLGFLDRPPLEND